MKRREFIAGISSAAAWPVVARGQQPALPVVGFLGGESPDLFAGRLRAFRQGLSESGYVEGKNVVLEYRWAEGRYDRLPGLVADLVRLQVKVIATSGGAPPALAAKAATTTIPIVFVTGSDPVQTGLVASLNQPGGNLTGVTSLNLEVGAKRLELLHEMLSEAKIFAALINPANPAEKTLSASLQTAARTLGLQLHILHASTESDFKTVFQTARELRARGLVIGQDSFFTARSEQLVTLSLQQLIPAVSQFRDFAVAGGLASYGSNFSDTYHQAGIYVGRVLKGEKPAELPVHQSTKIELIINMKTAKALGLTVPLSLLARADEVIE